MTALTTHTDTVSGWLLVIGCAFIALVWVGLSNYPRIADWWLDFRAPAKADRTITESPTEREQRLAAAPFVDAMFRESLSPAQSEAFDAHTDNAVARLQMQADADLLAMPGFGLRIPSQRKAAE